MEEEVRRIPERPVDAPQRLSEVALKWFGPRHGVTLELPRREPHEPLDFDNGQ